VAAVIAGNPLALIVIALMMGRMMTFVRIALFQLIGATTSRTRAGRPQTARMNDLRHLVAD
jgi:hypothetical protein